MEALFTFFAVALGTMVFPPILLFGFRVAAEYERCVVFRLGRLQRVAGPGLFWLLPFVEWQRTIDLRTITVDVPPQDAITRDSVTVNVDAVLYYRIVDPVKSVVAVADARSAIHLAALTSLRRVLGQHELDDLLKARGAINDSLQRLLAEMSGPWGIEVKAVEIKAVHLPDNMQRAMAKEAEAVREKRSRIIKAEAELEASEKLSLASRKILESPAALELRRLQMISEVGAEQNTTTIVLLPSDFVLLARNLAEKVAGVPATAA
ncbi:MAG: slipin family protein [Planctomycetes bacterium]|nr:slipin family protein [Planctomycetota bacterium]